jgi:hypothetical protein
MVGARHRDFTAVFANDIGNFSAVGRDDHSIGDVDVDDALPNANHQREAGEKAEGFLGEAGRAQPSWDYSERLHASRSARVALTAAEFTS